MSPSTTTVVAVDPFDDAAFDAWYDVYLAAEVDGRSRTASPWAREELRAEHQATDRGQWSAAYAVVDAGRTVAVASVELPLLDNLELAQLSALHTHPAHRRRGHASALLAHVEQVVRRRGRSVLVGEASFPYAGPDDRSGDGRGTPGPEFAYRHGFSLALADVQRTLDLPVDPATLTRLATAAAPHHAAYRLLSFTGRVPDELAQGYAEADAAVDTEAPTGDLDLEPAVASVDMVRSDEALLERQQRTRYTTIALSAAGEVAAYSDLVVPALAPGQVFQWGTLVRREHRGHRLGLAVKVANLAYLQAQRADLRLVRTYNAASNTHMVAINEQLGFRPVERLGEFQKRLG